MVFRSRMRTIPFFKQMCKSSLGSDSEKSTSRLRCHKNRLRLKRPTLKYVLNPFQNLLVPFWVPLALHLFVVLSVHAKQSLAIFGGTFQTREKKEREREFPLDSSVTLRNDDSGFVDNLSHGRNTNPAGNPLPCNRPHKSKNGGNESRERERQREREKSRSLDDDPIA